MLPENRSFLVRGDDGQEYGPVDLEELRGWVRENRAGLGTEVRLDEPGAAWSPWQNFPELVALLAHVHVTGPVPGQPGLVIAPLGRRVAAFTLDLIFIFILWVPILTALAFAIMPDFVVQTGVAASLTPFSPPELPLRGEIIMRLVYGSLVAFYFAGFQAAHGQTPAKALLRLRVVDQSGRKPSATRSLLRALALIFSMYLFFLPLTYAFFNPQRRAFHDFIAGTYVVEA
jgi:uncharacterized RDD family membrane protein YckC